MSLPSVRCAASNWTDPTTGARQALTMRIAAPQARISRSFNPQIETMVGGTASRGSDASSQAPGAASDACSRTSVRSRPDRQGQDVALAGGEAGDGGSGHAPSSSRSVVGRTPTEREHREHGHGEHRDRQQLDRVPGEALLRPPEGGRPCGDHHEGAHGDRPDHLGHRDERRQVGESERRHRRVVEADHPRRPSTHRRADSRSLATGTPEWPELRRRGPIVGSQRLRHHAGCGAAAGRTAHRTSNARRRRLPARSRDPSKPSETSSLSTAHIGSSSLRRAPVATSSSWRSRSRAVTTTVSGIAIDPGIATITTGSGPAASTAQRPRVSCSCPTLEHRSRVAPTRDTDPIDPCDLNSIAARCARLRPTGRPFGPFRPAQPWPEPSTLTARSDDADQFAHRAAPGRGRDSRRRPRRHGAPGVGALATPAVGRAVRRASSGSGVMQLLNTVTRRHARGDRVRTARGEALRGGDAGQSKGMKRFKNADSFFPYLTIRVCDRFVMGFLIVGDAYDPATSSGSRSLRRSSQAVRPSRSTMTPSTAISHS